MTNTPTRLALIGTGRWGSNIIKTIQALPDATLAYQTTRDWQTLVAKLDIDGVIIATPPHTHTEIALPFIERGLPVFIEKPMTMSVTEAVAIETASKKSGSPVFVGHIHLYNPAFIAATKTAKNIGAIRFLVGEGANNGPRREDYSAMWDWAPHDISMMLEIMGEMPTQVQAWGMSVTRPGTTLYDASEIKLAFAAGTTGIIFSSWLMPQKRKRLSVVGEAGSVVYDDTLSEKKTVLFTAGDTTPTYPTYDSALSLTLELQAFLRTIVEKEKPHSDVAMGCKVVQILDAAERSIAAGGVTVSIK